MSRFRGPALFVAVAAFGFFHAETTYAHNFSITQVVAIVKADGTYLIDIRIDVDALALGVSSMAPSAVVAASLRALSPDELKRAIERARDTILRRVRIRFDGQKVVPAVTFPEHEYPTNAANTVPSVLGATACLVGRYPDDATTFAFGASRAFNAVQLTILDEVSASGLKHVLGPGEDSPPYRLHETNIDDSGFVSVDTYAWVSNTFCPRD